MASVFRFVLFRPSSVNGPRDLGPAEESISSRTGKAITLSNLWYLRVHCILSSMSVLLRSDLRISAKVS